MVTTGMATTRKSSSTTKAFELLETVASAGTAGASPYDLAAASHVAVSTAHRYAASLLELGVLEKDGGGRYRLVDITMTKKDTIDHPDRPSRFAYGATQIEAEVPYTVFKDSPSVDMSVALHNPTDTAKSYEYWTCTTLAPGEEPTWGSPMMDIVTNVDTIRYDSAYRWMADVEQPAHPQTPTDRYLVLDKIKKMSEWRSDGIAYGQDLATTPQNNFWDVVNHENREGAVRVGDTTITPGMKFWEWGQNGSFDTNIFRRGSSERPYIELWAGTSDRFFSPAVLQPHQTGSWTESLAPALGLADVTNATADGAAHVGFAHDDEGVSVTANVFTTFIGQDVTAALVDDSTGSTLTSATHG
jgi:hypothetical protein